MVVVVVRIIVQPPKEEITAATTPAREDEPIDPDNPYGVLEIPEGYPFAEPDRESNLILGKDSDQPFPPIKGGTVAKLVERVTYDKQPGTQQPLVCVCARVPITHSLTLPPQIPIICSRS